MSATFNVAIRADAGLRIGTGHFARAAALAEALLSGGRCKLALMTSGEGAEIVPHFFPEQVQVVELLHKAAGPSAALEALRSAGFVPQVLCLDQYGEVPAWEAAAATAGIPLLVFDDLDAATRADLVVRPHCEPDLDRGKLGGPRYLPLAREIVEAGQVARPVGSVAQRLNICFGGSDPTGETARFLGLAGEVEGLQCDIAIGPRAQIDESLLRKAATLAHLTLHYAPSRAELARMLREADLALGAGGVMLWERLYLGVPSLVIATAANQCPQIDSMVEAGAIRFLGDHSKVNAAQIVDEIAALATNERHRRLQSERGRALVDGRGAERLASAIRQLTTT